MKALAVIPARGGSKRLPRKNTIDFLGRPIIHYSIAAAFASGVFDRVVVSTEDAAIRQCVAATGCEIHQRPADLATDTATVDAVVMAVLDWYEAQGRHFDYVCCLYATAPLRDADDIAASFEQLRTSGADFCMGVTDFPTSPFFALDLGENGRIRRRWPELACLPPDQRPRVVVDNGSLYWGRIEAFRRAGSLEGEHTVGYWMPRHRSIDIDTEEDLRLARFYAEKFP